MADEAPPEYMDDDQMQRRFTGGPMVKNAVMVLVGDRTYKREGGRWRLLDDRHYSTVKEMTDGA